MSDRLFRISNPKQSCLEFEIQNKTNIMGIKNKTTSNELYFLTFTVVDWVDVFTKAKYKHIIVDALQFAVNNKGLDLFAWCIMTNHIHLIARSKKNFELSDIIRDFKKFTNKAIIKLIEEEPESRRKWMLYRFEFHGKYNPKIKDYKFWKDGSDAKHIYSKEFFMQKLNYIHNNPVKDEIVAEPHHYLYSSAIDYTDEKGLVDVIVV